MSETDTQRNNEFAAASFRDPAGGVVVGPHRVIRVVSADGAANVSALLASKVAQHFVERGQMIASRMVGGAQAQDLLRDLPELATAAAGRVLLEHDRVSFPSFPYEWCPAMLAAAGRLTLDLADGLLGEGIGLKDATPYNVLFRGPEPVFIDVLSLEPRRTDDPVWLPYGQFLRTFLLPLLANQHFGMPLDQVFLTRRDGLEPEEVYRWCGPLRKLHPAFLGTVTLPTWLSGKAEAKSQTLYRARSEDPGKVEYLLHALLRRLGRSVDSATGKTPSSRWSQYMDRTSTYTESELTGKKAFVSRFLEDSRPQRVLDIGCNTGVYSLMAAEAGAEVVATDLDPPVIERLWKTAREQRKNILPLVVDFSRPTPATGWRNRECPSFLDRARGGFDAVFMLALVHHLLVTERVPLGEILSLAAEITRKFLLIEYVGPEDPMFKRLTRGRAHLHAGLAEGTFEQECSRHFELVSKQPIKESYRTVYLLKKR